MNRTSLGRWMIAAGVAVWGVFVIVWLAGAEPHAGSFLPFHLGGVIPGFILARWDLLRGRRPAADPDGAPGDP
jgi:hypothetical protein